MNIKIFGAFVVALGVLLAAGAGVVVALNQPQTEFHSRPLDLGGGVVIQNDLDGMLERDLANSKRRDHREQVIPLAIVGAVVAFIGVGLVVASRNGKPDGSKSSKEVNP